MRSDTSGLLVLVGLVTLFIAACSTAPPKESAMMDDVEGVEFTKRELQSIIYGYANYFAGQIELGANDIYTQSSDPAVRTAAIAWNLNAPPEMMKACFNHDPLIGLVSAWTFTIEMRQFFESGNGKDVFGSSQPVAIETARRVENEMTKLVQMVWPTGDVDEYEQRAENWAAEHPLKNMRFVRETYHTDMTKEMGAAVAGGLGAAGAMNEQMVAMNHRANILLPYLQRQAHWQAVSLMDNSRVLVGEATDSTLVAVREEMFRNLEPIFAFADEQRALVVRDLARERAAVIAALVQERSAVITSLSEERTQVLAVIAEQRDATMRDINALTLETLDRVADQSQNAVTASVDHIYQRTIQLLAIPMAVMAIFVVLVMIWVRNTVNRMLARAEAETNRLR